MQLSAQENAAKPLPVYHIPVNTSVVLSPSAFSRPRGPCANRFQAASYFTRIKPNYVACSTTRTPRTIALTQAPGRILSHAQP